MKKVIVLTCVLIIFIGGLTITIMSMKNYIDTSFATEISLKYYYDDKKIDVIITDKNDIGVIKENLKGISYKDNPSCGFSLDISLTLFGGEKSITICPANDSCYVAGIGDTNRYINIKDRKALEGVLNKYGMTFPCV